MAGRYLQTLVGRARARRDTDGRRPLSGATPTQATSGGADAIHDPFEASGGPERAEPGQPVAGAALPQGPTASQESTYRAVVPPSRTEALRWAVRPGVPGDLRARAAFATKPARDADETDRPGTQALTEPSARTQPTAGPASKGDTPSDPEARPTLLPPVSSALRRFVGAVARTPSGDAGAGSEPPVDGGTPRLEPGPAGAEPRPAPFVAARAPVARAPVAEPPPRLVIGRVTVEVIPPERTAPPPPPPPAARPSMRPATPTASAASSFGRPFGVGQS